MPVDLGDEGMAEEWTRSLVIPLPKQQQQNNNLKHCQNCRTISLLSYPSKIMLRVILDRLKAKAEELLAEEQAGFRRGRSAIGQILNVRVVIQKHLQHRRDLFHSFKDFKKTFDRIFHASPQKLQSIQALYENSSSAVLSN